MNQSGNWADILDAVDPIQEIILDDRELEPVQPNPSVQPSKEFSDRYDAPVIWIRKTHGLTSEELQTYIMKAFEEAGVKDVQIVQMYVSFSSHKNHAYMVLSSVRHSDMLLDGTINVPVESEEDEEMFLWFEKADHLEPRETQDPNILYIWQLPANEPSSEVYRLLELAISALAPIVKMEVSSREDGMCDGWAKVVFNHEFDTQKCVYMFNYNHFMGCEIRAVFCNSDWVIKKRPAKSSTPPSGGTRKKKPAQTKDFLIPKEPRPVQNKPLPKPSASKPKPKIDDGWGTVIRSKTK